MMERRALMISVGISLLSMYLVWQYVSTENERLQQAYGVFFPMVVASNDILQYQTIRPTDIEVIQVPRAMVPAGRVGDPNHIIDSVAAVPMKRGEHILDNKIISKNIYSGLNTQIAVEKRAISIPVNVKSSIDYLLRPGNRIDLAAHFEYQEQKNKFSEVKVFMQDLLVLAVGKTIQTDTPAGVDARLLRNVMSKFEEKGLNDPKEASEMINYAKGNSTYQTVTLEVTPFQAQKIVYVMTVFPDTLVTMLRHSDDRALPRTDTVNLYDVMGPESYLVKGNKTKPVGAQPRPKFYDYVEGQRRPVY